MQIATEFLRAEGNDKVVWVDRNVDTHTAKITYFGGIDYRDEPHLNFDEKFKTRQQAQRWFKVWKQITQEGW